jgi:hypothetical protein
VPAHTVVVVDKSQVPPVATLFCIRKRKLFPFFDVHSRWHRFLFFVVCFNFAQKFYYFFAKKYIKKESIFNVGVAINKRSTGAGVCRWS